MSNRIGPLAGYRTGGSGRNGISGGGYRRNGMEGWNPAKGVHFDEAAVRPKPAGGPSGTENHENARRRAERLARVVELARLTESGKSVREAARDLGITEKTAYDYLREMRKWGGDS